MKATVKPSDVLSLLEKQEYKCAYSGLELTPDNISADHFIPVSRGGHHTIDNIRLVTGEVNRAKGTMSFDEFVKMCKAVAEKFPNG